MCCGLILALALCTGSLYCSNPPSYSAPCASHLAPTAAESPQRAPELDTAKEHRGLAAYGGNALAFAHSSLASQNSTYYPNANRLRTVTDAWTNTGVLSDDLAEDFDGTHSYYYVSIRPSTSCKLGDCLRALPHEAIPKECKAKDVWFDCKHPA